MPFACTQPLVAPASPSYGVLIEAADKTMRGVSQRTFAAVSSLAGELRLKINHFDVHRWQDLLESPAGAAAAAACRCRCQAAASASPCLTHAGGGPRLLAA